MRFFFIVLSILGILVGIVLTILPFDYIPLVPLLIAFALSFLTLKTSEPKEKKFPRILMVISFLLSVIAFGKNYFVKDTIGTDEKFEKRIEESNKENIQELEEIQSELDSLESDLEEIETDLEEIEDEEIPDE